MSSNQVLVFYDRVWETTTTTGTGTLSLAGAKAGYQSFSVVGNGNKTTYCITDGTNWEMGEGTYSSSTLSRDIVKSSSNSGNLVNFGAGSKDVFLTPTASYYGATRSQFVSPIVSGTIPTLLTEESISGTRAVAISQSGNIRIAMASVSGRMPAVGIVVDNVASGIQTNVYSFGTFQLTSGMADYSGYIGSRVYVGRSGQIVTTSASFNSGAFLSRDVWHPLGAALNSGSVLLETSTKLSFVLTQILSGDIASGQISQFHLSSGAVNSGQIGSGAVIGRAGNGAFNIASGTIGTLDIASGAITSGLIASGQVGHYHIASGSVTSGQLGVTGTPDGTKYLRDDFTWQTAGGAVGSGTLDTYKFASGATITRAQFVAPFVSGTSWTAITEEPISGTRAVSVSQSGNIRIAMASVSGRMPAVGIIVDNVASGIQANVHTVGVFQLTSGMADYSGYLGNNLYVGRSGQIITTSGSFNSGGLLSGDVWQPIGTAVNSGAALVEIALQLPFVATQIFSGDIASGQISQFHLAPGAVNSGHIGSGAVIGRAGNGAFNIASGTIGTLDIASGAITSSLIASGQVGFGHLANASVRSGTITSGAISHFHVASGSIMSGQLGVTGTPDGTKFLRDDFTWQTAGGAVGSGTLDTYKFASGATITRAQFVAPFVSGTSWTAITEEIISGFRAVAMSPSGNIRIAMAGDSTRMPAIGIINHNVASGIQANVHNVGVFQLSSGLADYSGFIGNNIYVGRSGQVVTTSGSFNSGGLLSGDIWQPVGVVTNSGGCVIAVAAVMPFVATQVLSGNIGSGQIGNNHLSPNAVQSGDIGSGTPITYAQNVMFEDFVANETVSGLRAVAITSGGTVVAARGASGLRMPAIGVNANNVLSGAICRVIMQGRVDSSDTSAFSGQVGKMLYVSSSGFRLTPTKPATTTITQRIGIALSGGVLVSPALILASGNMAASASGSI